MEKKPTYEELEARIKSFECEIHELKRIEQSAQVSESMFRALFEQAGGYCMLLQPSDNGIPNVLDINKAACEVHGYTRNEIIGRPVTDLDDEEGKALCRERTETIMSGKTLSIRTNHIHKDGSVFPVAVFANKIEIAGRLPIIMTTEHDISEIEFEIAERTKELLKTNTYLEELALTDPLTGLSNRRHAMQQLTDSWDDSSVCNTPLVCMMIDSDNFKAINDTHGHDAGDIVLCKLAETLQLIISDSDVACRLGGDEFLIICPNTNLENGLRIAESICKKISQHYKQDANKTWYGSVSIGVAARSFNMANYQELLKTADKAVYEAKRSGKNCVKALSW